MIKLSILIILQQQLSYHAPDSYKTQEICDKAVDKCFLTSNCISYQNKTQETCDRAISGDPFMLVYCPDNDTQTQI